MILATTPAPTVRPTSRIANRKPSSIAIGEINSTFIWMLTPAIDNSVVSRRSDVRGAVELPEATEMVMPGDNIQMKVELISPIAMEEGLRFAIREGGRTVGAGVVAKIIQ